MIKMIHRTLITTPEISKRMSKVKLKDGVAEKLLAKKLWHEGIRYRKNYRKIPGSPDIAITKTKIAIFVDGEFWHGYCWNKRKLTIKTNRDYWVNKIEENISRDLKVKKLLEIEGWKVIRFWEKDIKKDVDNCLTIILKLINDDI